MKKLLSLILVLSMALTLTACVSSSASSGGVIKIGYVNPYTGALAGHGEGCDWVIDQITTYVNETMGGIELDGGKWTIDVISYDSGSAPEAATEMAQKLCDEDEVDLIIAIHTPETVNPVVAVAEKYDVPCIGIQAPVNPISEALTTDAEWTVHSFWTVEKVYEQYRALWTAAGYPPHSGAKVGIAFANDSDGTAWSPMFIENLEADGYELVFPGLYPSGTTDFTTIVNTFKQADIDILAGCNIPPDFSNLFTQMIAAGVEVDCITMGKCCLLEGDAESLGENVLGIMTEVWWAPTNSFVSELTGISCAELGEAFSADNNGRTVPQPVGFAYAALELAVQAFQAAGTTDKEAVRDAIFQLDVETVVGRIKYDLTMGGLKYSHTAIGGGQWQLVDGEPTLVVIDNTVFPEFNTTGSYVEGNATTK